MQTIYPLFSCDNILKILCKKPCVWIILTFLSASLFGCGVFRGIPSHGGGKRFDEEQRVVAGSIRHALAAMNIHELTNKRVKIIVDALGHDGGATAHWPGLQDIGISGFPFDKYVYENFHEIFKSNDSENHSNKWIPSYRDNNTYHPGTNLNTRYRPFMTYNPHRVSSEPDLYYLKAALNMKARHSGITLSVDRPDIILYVLVDILGTNRSRLDLLVMSKDRLKATCELTYYAQEIKTGRIVFHARRTSASTQYTETSVLYARLDGQYQLLEDTNPTPFPVNGGSMPSSGNTDIDIEFNPAVVPSTEKQNLITQEYLNTLIKNAALQLELNNPDLALQDLEQIRAIDPDFPGLAELLRELEQHENKEP